MIIVYELDLLMNAVKRLHTLTVRIKQIVAHPINDDKILKIKADSGVF